VVGRQASAADIRIDHGSISRRHAALYYAPTPDGSGAALTLQDLGGKHGTHVDGTRMPKRSAAELRDGTALVFGNVREREFVVRLPPSMKGGDGAAAAAGAAAAERVDGAISEGKVGDVNGDIVVPANKTTESDRDDADDKAEADPFEGLSGRERREAEIAAMMATLDENPAYQKYSAPPSQDDAPEDVPIGQHSDANGGGTAPTSSAPGGQSGGSSVGSIGGKLGLPVTKTAPFASSASAVPTPSDPKPGGGRALSALSLDPSGSRLVTGCTDTNLRMYDFNGMDADQKAFREVTVEEGHPITALCHSNTGDRMLVGTTSAQPMVVDRDGREIIQFAKGDVYMTDMSKTIGHTATVTDVAWHPLEKDKVMTASIDGSARMWNLSSGKTAFKKLKCDSVYRAKNSKGIRTAVTACAYHPSGREICLGTADGSIQIWDATRVKPRPDKVIYDVHGTGKAICFVGYSHDGKRLVSRSSDDTAAKVWEARRVSRSSRPILVAGGLPCLFDGSNCAFSPDGSVLVAGTSVEPLRKKNSGNHAAARGTIRFYRIPPEGSAQSDEAQDSLLELEAAPPGASIVKASWHHKLNQIFVAASDGSCRVFYDERLSKRGALLTTSKGVKRKDDLSLLLESRAPQGSVGLGANKIIAPHSLPMYRDEKQGAGKRKREELKDPVKSKRPQAPEGGVKTGGQTSASVNFTQFVVKSTIKNKNIAGKDPREELFKYSEGKSFSSKAYEGDQERVLASKTAEQEEEDMKSKKK
jgi:WD40 repeat protein